MAEQYPIIGQVRGKGLLLGLELVEDPRTRQPFAESLQVAQMLTDEAFADGLIIYPRRSLNGPAGDHVLVAPPLIIDKSDVEIILNRLGVALERTIEKIRS
jgi:adenosylmethionine-8-amino-7-oxononanoate aminotransferase